jgi:hypothetical protein
MIVNNGYKLAVNRIGKAVPDYTASSRFQVGINQATVAVADNALTFAIPINSNESVSTCEATTGWTAGTDGAITTNSTTYKQGSYSLNLTKTGATADNVMWYNQTLSSLDFTSKTLYGWIYIKDATTLAKLHSTTALEVRYGNDYNTNYYYKVYTNAQLAVGWNLLYFSTATSTQQGTVDLAHCDSLNIKLTYTATSDTTTAGDIVIDDFKLASSGDYYKNYESGYPSVDETLYEITEKLYLNSTEANGFNITGVGTFNTDGSALAESIFKITSTSKSDTDEFAYYIKKRLTRR